MLETRFFRLLQFMLDDTLCIELRHECAIVLGSLAKGTREDILALIDAGAISVLLKGRSTVQSCMSVKILTILDWLAYRLE